MPKFFNSDLADLAHQLTLSPRRLRVEQLRGIERLLATVEPSRAYPYEFVCFHITGYRKRGGTTGDSIPGKALISDLVTMGEVLSRKSRLTVSEIGEPVDSHLEVAQRLSVSTKTVRRWRNRGLMGLRAYCDDGVNRLVFPRATVDRFITQHKALVEKGASFRQLSRAERDHIVELARGMVSRRPIRLHAAARIIAEQTGRAIETIRYTLRRHDAATGVEPIFTHDGEPVHCEHALAIWNARHAGESVEAIAKAMACSVEEVEQGLRTVQVQKWRHEPLDFIHNELFDAPNADALILDAPEPEAPETPEPKVPKDLPPYLQSLYRTPLLTREQEADLFRRYNYLKYKFGKRLNACDDDVTAECFDELNGLLRRIEEARRRIIRANLRLVVSIAKRHVGWSPNFFEVISDGNMSLMRAVEKFDYARGNKFSTYATWAVMKNYARSIPEERYHMARYVTGQELTMETVADESEAPASPSDRDEVRRAIEQGLEELNERERQIVREHFGLGNRARSATLEQLGQRLGVTKERVRQIEQKALARLREVLSPHLIDAL
jgi:RNA polymerase primary sigma factor